MKKSVSGKITFMMRAIFFALVAVAVIYVIKNMFFLVKGTRDEQKAKETVSEWEDDIDDFDTANSQRWKDYVNGDTGMGGDEDTVLDEDMIDAEDSIMCQDLYDSDGNLIWKGIDQKEAEEPSKETIEAFDKAYKVYENAGQEVTEDTKLEIDASESVNQRLKKLCVEYNATIPYAQGGYSYYLGYEKEEKGYDNIGFIKEGQKGFGLCGLGYVTWCVRNVLGYTPKALQGQKLNVDKLQEIKGTKKLRVGDICVADTNEGVMYGMVCGEIDNNHLVTMCDARSVELFPAGANHLSYIRSETDTYIGTYQAVAFNRFYRLKEWRKS